MKEYGECEICKQPLEEYEAELLSCGHYACNSCTYSEGVRKGLNKDVCENCFESPSQEEK